MSSNLAEEKRYAYQDYITWNSKIRYELIDGAAYAMAAPSQAHQEILGELHRQLANFLRGKSCKVFVAPFAVRLNSNSFDDIVVEPDLLVVCDKSKLDGKSVKGAPDFIIEILSPFNTRHDTFTKFRHYQRAGVLEYWIVDPVSKSVQVNILENGKYVGRTYSDEDIVVVHTLEGCQINLAEVFYDTIEFESDENEPAIRQRIINAMKASGISDSQVEKIIKLADEEI
jgi:Uma2 family endonuclease